MGGFDFLQRALQTELDDFVPVDWRTTATKVARLYNAEVRELSNTVAEKDAALAESKKREDALRDRVAELENAASNTPEQL